MFERRPVTMEISSTITEACEVMSMQAASKNLKIDMVLPVNKVTVVADK
jgi:hypothetical protein